MYQQSQLATQQSSQVLLDENKVSSFITPEVKNRVLTSLHRTLMALGLAAIMILSIMFIKPDLAEKFKNLSPYRDTPQVETAPEVAPPNLSMLMATPEQLAHEEAKAVETTATTTQEDGKLLGNQRQQQWVTSWLAKRYRVASDASNMLVSAAYLTAKEIKLDPLLILSVMAIESGLNPFAESPVGAQGLMQVMSKIHHEKFETLGGVKAALNPVANIKVGATILKDYVTRGGSVEAGLKLYVGAAAFDNDAGYGSRVLAEYRKLKDVSSGKNVPATTSSVIPASTNSDAAIKNEKKSLENKTLVPEVKTPDQLATL